MAPTRPTGFYILSKTNSRKKINCVFGKRKQTAELNRNKKDHINTPFSATCHISFPGYLNTVEIHHRHGWTSRWPYVSLLFQVITKLNCIPRLNTFENMAAVKVLEISFVNSMWCMWSAAETRRKKNSVILWNVSIFLLLLLNPAAPAQPKYEVTYTVKTKKTAQLTKNIWRLCKQTLFATTNFIELYL